MDFIVELLNNQVFVSAALGWLVAQVLKTLIHLILTKRFVVERMVGSGGMPSCHSATVCGLATAAGIKYGGGSFEFAIAVMLSIIVMYDAMGVRRETGKQGQVLNEMMEIFTNMGAERAGRAHTFTGIDGSYSWYYYSSDSKCYLVRNLKN